VWWGQMVSSSLLSIALIVVAVGASQAPLDPTCQNVLPQWPPYLNTCFKTPNDSIITMLANWVIQWINPRFQATAVVAAILVLPLLAQTLQLKNSFPALVKVERMKLLLAFYLHVLSIGLVLDVGLYTVFRQRRPCECYAAVEGEGPLLPIGSYYGMPSGDAMAAGVLGMFFIRYGLGHFIGGRILGVLIILAAGLERMTLGFHTLGQVTVGASMGAGYVLLAPLLPMACLPLVAVHNALLAMLAIFADPNLHFPPNSMLNLWSWTIWGAACDFFACALILRWHLRLPHASLWGLTSSMQTLLRGWKRLPLQVTPEARYLFSLSGSGGGGGGGGGSVASSKLHGTDREGWQTFLHLDGLFTWGMFAIALLIMLFSSLTALYDLYPEGSEFIKIDDGGIHPPHW
jgi:membrane-associated phospholipid phosphatase